MKNTSLHNLNNKFAYTLAEVLVVLGVVGVISALTLPTLITNYRIKLLKTQFAVADNIIQNAVKKTCYELNCDSLTEYYDGIPTDANVMRRRAAFVNETWVKQFPTATKISRMTYYAKGYNLLGDKLNDMVIPYWSNDYFYQLPNGIVVGPMVVWGRDAMGVFFDVNGPKHGPNRIGYDIFIYNTLTSKGGGYQTLCNPTITHSQNMYGCWAWAHNNINPETKQHNYWDILYKPKNWWYE